MSSVTFKFEHTCTGECGHEDLIIEVSAIHYDEERAPRDEYGRPEGDDFPAYIGDFEIVRAYTICSTYKIEISQIKPDINDVQDELEGVCWDHYEAAKNSYYEYEVQF